MIDVRGGPGPASPALPVGDAIDFLRQVWAVDHALQRRSESMAVTRELDG